MTFDVALEQFASVSGENVHSWKGYLTAHRKRRAFFASAGATATGQRAIGTQDWWATRPYGPPSAIKARE